jgi:hypothetical protein
MRKIVPSTSMWVPFLNWLVLITARKASRHAAQRPLSREDSSETPAGELGDQLVQRRARVTDRVAAARCSPVRSNLEAPSLPCVVALARVLVVILPLAELATQPDLMDREQDDQILIRAL